MWPPPSGAGCSVRRGGLWMGRPGHGWHELFADRYPDAGGDRIIALYLENSEAYEGELVVAPE